MNEEIIQSKKCSVCKEEKPISGFYKNNLYKFGVSCRCKKCSNLVGKNSYKKHLEKRKNTSKKYRLKNIEKLRLSNKIWRDKNPLKVAWYSKESRIKNPDRFKNAQLKYEYGITLEKYNQLFVNQNGLCAICGIQCSLGQKLCVDHDHKTSKVRGLLCKKCNSAIGFFNDDKDILIKAFNYLNKNG